MLHAYLKLFYILIIYKRYLIPHFYMLISNDFYSVKRLHVYTLHLTAKTLQLNSQQWTAIIVTSGGYMG